MVIEVTEKMMDYTYISQLIDRYFEAETSLEEEKILRAFFAQNDVPAEFEVYAEIFREQSFLNNAETLGADFDNKVRKACGVTDNESVTIARSFSLRPLWRAVACVAIVLAIGQAAQMPYSSDEQTQQEQVARTMEMLQRVQQDQNSVAKSDSIKDTKVQLN